MSDSLHVLEGFELPKFVVIDKEAQEKTAELFRLWEGVLADPNAQTYIRGRNSIERRVPHRNIAGVILQAVRAETVEVSGIPNPEMKDVEARQITYSQLGVIEQSGAMTLNIEHRNIGALDLRDDPFTTMIMDYFRSHLDAA